MTEARGTLRNREHDLEILNEIAKALTSTLQLSEIMRIVLARIKTLTFAEAISLLLYDAQRDELVFSATETLRESTFGAERSANDRGIAAWVARTGESTIVNDPASDSRCAGAADPLPPCEGLHLLAVPLKRDGAVVGVIELADRYDGEPFDADDLATVERMAAVIGPTIDAESLSSDGVQVRRVLAEVTAAVPSQAASLLLYDPSGRSLVFSGSRRLQPGVIDGLRMSVERGIAGWVARHRQALRLDDASADPRHDRAIGSEMNFRPHGMLCVPVVSKDQLLGVIQVINRIGGGTFDDEELRLVQILADHAAIAIENASLYRQAQLASLTDDLTGLANSRHLNQFLPEQVRRGGTLALLVLDFDNFKQVVDRYGHLVGSQTIAHIGRMIGKLIRPGDFAARFGGDEFVVILPNHGVEAAVTFAEALRREIAACTRLDGRDIDLSAVTASIGVAVFPDHAADADGLLHAADAAMYAVKRRGKNGVAVAE
jgi:diguanylate cyclase (GGDEF)-like protein